MASGFGYCCSLCEMALKTEKGWLNHLLSPDHQTKAREDFASWDFQTKDRVLVIFGKFSVASESVLGAFSDEYGRSNLSGFLWNEKRPRVGLLRFETRYKANEVMNGLSEGCQIIISNYQLVQLKKAVEYLDLEWEELIAQDFRSDIKKEVKTEFKTEEEPDEKSFAYKRMKLYNSDSDEDENSGIKNEIEEDYAPVNRKIIKVEPGVVAPSIFNPVPQLDFVRKIEIRDEAYNEALELMENCRRVLNVNYEGCRLFMIRHWYLKLHGQGENELIFYFDAEGVLASMVGGAVRRLKKLSGGFLKNFLRSCIAQKILPGMWNRVDCKEMNACLGFEEQSAQHLEDTISKAKFTLVIDFRYAVEAQTCRLLNYLLDFDQRARPLLTLIFYWAEQNRVKISNFDSSRNRHLSFAFAQEPAGLEWMVIFYLCHKGILPSPRRILEQASHPQVWYQWDNFRYDIGFRMDAEFAKEWATAGMANHPLVGSNEFVLHLVKLSQEFFTFYGQLRSTSQQWVLNTKDGELLRTEGLLSRNPWEFGTRLTKEELAQLRNQELFLTTRHKKLNGLSNRRLTILHPLILQWTIPCDEVNFFGKISLEMLTCAKMIEDSCFPTLDGSRGDEDEDKKYMTNLQNLFRA